MATKAVEGPAGAGGGLPEGGLPFAEGSLLSATYNHNGMEYGKEKLVD